MVSGTVKHFGFLLHTTATVISVYYEKFLTLYKDTN